MAARKPAITGLARPQGIVDDIAKFGIKGAKQIIKGRRPKKEALKGAISAERKRATHAHIMQSKSNNKTANEVATILSKRKETVTRKQVSNARKKLKGK